MNRKRRILHGFMAKWGLPYIVISAVAFAVIAYGVNRYSSALRNEMEYSNSVVLETMQILMDRTVEDMKVFCGKATLDETIRKLRQETSSDNISRYDLYNFVKGMNGDQILGTNAGNCYLYFPQIDFVVSGNRYGNSREFWQINLSESGYTYEEWYAIISRDYRSMQMLSLQKNGGGKYTVFARPLDFSAGQRNAVNVIMISDLEKILSGTRKIGSGEDKDQICVADRVTGRIFSNEEVNPETEAYLLNHLPTDESGNQDFTANGRQSIVSYIRSAAYENWYYMVVTPEQSYLKRLRDTQYLAMGLVGIYLLFSIVMILYGYRSQYKPIRNAVDRLKEENVEIDGGKKPDDGNAYEYLNESVQKLLNLKEENASAITSQKKAIMTELLRRLLTAENAYDFTGIEQLSLYGVEIGERKHMVLAYIPDRMDAANNSAGNAGKDGIPELTWFAMENVTKENLSQYKAECYCVREGKMQLYLILSGRGQEDTLNEDVKAAVKITSEFLFKNLKISYRIALSGSGKGIPEIHDEYRQVRRVFEYQKSPVYSKAVSYQDINILPDDTLLKYPLETENRLYNSVCAGETEASLKIVDEIFQDNRKNILVPEATQFLINNIISTVSRAASAMLKNGTEGIPQKYMVLLSRNADSGNPEEKLKEVIENLCREIAELKTKGKEDQRDTLYRNIQDYVEKNFSNPDLSVNDIAQKYGMQSAYISKVYKEKSGENLSANINGIRVAHAKELLLKDGRLEEIAEQCGFGSQRTFLRIFKQYVGLTPTQYRDVEKTKQNGAKA